MRKDQSYLKDAADLILNLLYPPRCPVCDGIPPYGERICPRCRQSLPYIRANRCRICGKPVEADEVLCDDCRRNPHAFEEGMGVFLYDDTMREVMARLKFKGRREYGGVLGDLVYEETKTKIALWQPDAVVPVPVHQKKLAKRGYNQAEEIARPIALKAKVPLRTDLLVRTRETGAMKELNREERRANLKGAFSLSGHIPVPNRVLLVDDIYTTGATIDACTLALKAGGARSVTFLSVCIGMGYMVRY